MNRQSVRRAVGALITLMITLLAWRSIPAQSQVPSTLKIESDDTQVVREGQWISQPASAASGGSYLYNDLISVESGQAAVLQLTFEGPTLEVIYVSGPTLGTLALEVDGTVLRTIITTADQTSYGQSTKIDYLTNEDHILRVYAQAGDVVGVDAFVIPPLANDVGVNAGVSRSACDNITRVQRASESSVGVEANYDSRLGQRPISNEGRYVVFETSASNLVANDTNNTSDIFVRDRVTCTTTRASVASDGTQANNGSFWGAPSISSDGRYVVFTSAASNLVPNDTNGVDDVFLRDRQTNSTTRVSLSNTGQQLISASGDAMISGNGRYVTFLYGGSDAVSDDNNGEPDVFVRDLQLNTTVRVSITNSGNENDDFSSHPFISETGQFVTFSSGGTALVAGDTNAVPDIFVRDLVNNTTIRVSVADDESEGNGASGDYSPITPDGRYVMFSSIASNLVAGDNNGFADVFVRDLAATTTMRVSLSSSGGESNGNSFGSSISDDGTLVAFLSGANNLVSGDTNQRDDLFVRNLSNQTTIATSRTFDGLLAQGVTTDGRMSTNGRYMVLINSSSLAKLPMPLPIYHAYVNDLLLLYAPATLTATAVSDGQIGLTWMDTQTDETEFRIERSPNGTSNWMEIGTAPANTTTYTNVSLLCNTPYFYRVRAYRASDMTYSAYSNVANATTAACPTSCNPNDVVQLVSRASDGTFANATSSISSGNSRGSALSDNGRYVAFSSQATSLVPNDTNNLSDIFLVDRQTCQIWRISLASNSTQSNADSYGASISGDGRYIGFASTATNLLIVSDPYSYNDVFIHDRQTGQTRLVSGLGNDTAPIFANNDSTQLRIALSDDGRLVTFTSKADNLVIGDTNTNPLDNDVFVKDMQAGAITRVSLHADGTQSQYTFVYPDISGDGRYVVFHGDDALVPNDIYPGADVYLYDRQTGQPYLVSVATGGVHNTNSGGSYNAAISDDGRFIVFWSYSTFLVANDTNSQPDVFLHDRLLNQTIRVSQSVNGVGGNDDSLFPSISDGGRFVAFYSCATNLGPIVTAGFCHTYLWDRLTHEISLVSRSADGIVGNSSDGLSSVSGDGHFVAFQSSSTNLVPNDINGMSDVFVTDVGKALAKPDTLSLFNSTMQTANLVKTLTNPPAASDYVYYTTGFPYGGGGNMSWGTGMGMASTRWGSISMGPSGTPTIMDRRVIGRASGLASADRPSRGDLMPASGMTASG